MDYNATVNEPIIIEQSISDLENLNFKKYYTNFRRAEAQSTESSVGESLINDETKNVMQIGEKVLNKLKGFIESIDENSVRIKFDNNLIVNFPKLLFKDQKLLTFGKSLIYCIKTDNRGYRYQDFMEDEIIPDRDKDELIKQINDL